jgi:homoserine O-succinyltransferase
MQLLGLAPTTGRYSGAYGPLVIGLVNNASDRALKSTEGLFVKALQTASGETDLRLRFFTCPEVPRATSPQTPLGQPYSAIDRLFDTHVDALIVTGMEPQATRLQDEPIWPSLTKLVDWAKTSATPVLWSCLAAHAAVLRLDGVSRAPLGGKMSGLFECDVVSTGHPLMTGLPSRWAIPHSRYYSVPEALLADKGYQILSRSPEAGADIFVKNADTPFVFFQGHPEYDTDTLLREYKRDLRRYFAGEQVQCPMPPRRYFNRDMEAALARLRERALEARGDATLLDEILHLVRGVTRPDAWQNPAAQLFANWLRAVAQRGALSRRPEKERRPERDRLEASVDELVPIP